MSSRAKSVFPVDFLVWATRASPPGGQSRVLYNETKELRSALSSLNLLTGKPDAQVSSALTSQL